eukprot:360863-Chlamydomonas_euryale.AAC.2
MGGSGSLAAGMLETLVDDMLLKQASVGGGLVKGRQAHWRVAGNAHFCHDSQNFACCALQGYETWVRCTGMRV